MLAQFSRKASFALIKQAFLRPSSGHYPSHGWLCCLTCPAQVARQPVRSFARVYASNTQWDRELKRQIISSADKAQFRYDVDSHKSHTDAALDQAEQAIGHQFHNRQLLRQAFMHTSASVECNVQLAWLGDAVLQVVVSEGLLSRYSSASIGDLSVMRAAMVGRNSCFKYAKRLGLQRFLVVGNAIDKTYSSDLSARTFSHNIMAELFEAVLGAVYVDTNLEQSHVWFAKQIEWPRNFQAAVNRFAKSNK